MAEATLRRLTLDVPDFPKPGIVFKDITPVLEDPAALKEVIDAIASHWADRGITRIVGIESRGFIFGAALAYAMDLGLTLVRKPGKLPADTISAEYNLEYGSNTLEMHTDALSTGQRVVIVDDLLATGGTVGACVDLCDTQGAVVVGALFVIELTGLGARENLSPVPVHALVDFPA